MGKVRKGSQSQRTIASFFGKAVKDVRKSTPERTSPSLTLGTAAPTVSQTCDAQKSCEKTHPIKQRGAEIETPHCKAKRRAVDYDDLEELQKRLDSAAAKQGWASKGPRAVLAMPQLPVEPCAQEMPEEVAHPLRPTHRWESNRLLVPCRLTYSSDIGALTCQISTTVPECWPGRVSLQYGEPYREDAPTKFSTTGARSADRGYVQLCSISDRGSSGTAVLPTERPEFVAVEIEVLYSIYRHDVEGNVGRLAWAGEEAQNEVVMMTPDEMAVAVKG